MFKVTFWKTVWNGSSPESSTSHSVFQKIENLPFVPNSLVQFSWPLELLPAAPASVRWDFEERQFVCTMPDEFPHEIEFDKYDYEWLVKHSKDCGWFLVKEFCFS